MIEYIEPLLEGIEDLISNPGMVIMWLISGLLYYFGIYKKKEPLLLIPISTGILLANLPMGELLRTGGNGEPEGFIRIFQNIGMSTDVLPLLIFLGMGALTDFEPVLSNPKTLLLGAAAQFGVFIALVGALLISLTPIFDFGLLEAASIGIIGGADGPTTIFISTRMREIGESIVNYDIKDIVGATAEAILSVANAAQELQEAAASPGGILGNLGIFDFMRPDVSTPGFSSQLSDCYTGPPLNLSLIHI